MKHRVGKFYITSNFLETISSIENISNILSQMKFVPTKVDYLYAEDRFEYIGISPMFNERKLGMYIPEYTIEIINKKVVVREIIKGNY